MSWEQGQSAGVRRLVALHAPTVDVLFELLLEDACRGLALGMVWPHHASHTMTERNHIASNAETQLTRVPRCCRVL